MNSNSISSGDVRKFGMVAFISFGGLFVVGIWTEKMLPVYFFGCLSMLGAGFAILPSRLKPVYKCWLKIGFFLRTVVTISILILSYFLVITPSAMLRRALKGRPLPVKPNLHVKSYWVDRTEPAQSKERFAKRF